MILISLLDGLLREIYIVGGMSVQVVIVTHPIYGKAEVRFLRGRLHFVSAGGAVMDAAPFPSMVVVFRR